MEVDPADIFRVPRYFVARTGRAGPSGRGRIFSGGTQPEGPAIFFKFGGEGQILSRTRKSSGSSSTLSRPHPQRLLWPYLDDRTILR